MSNGLFITGTDTEVGKTIVTAAFAAGYRMRGGQPIAVKPMATGGDAPGEDAQIIADAAGHSPRIHTCLPEPASPERAAIEAKVHVDMDDVIGWIQDQATHANPLLVEGVGGWCVPLGPNMWISDLAKKLALPVIIVAANRLGMINHTLLTVDAVHRCGLTVAGIVINNHFAPASPLAEWNVSDIKRHVGSDIPVVTITTRNADLDQTGLDLLNALGL